MIGALFYGLTGLRNHETRINVIGNNIANINTTGYKKSRATFKEAFDKLISSGMGSTDTRGSINPKQVGYGVQLGSIDVIHTEGNIQLTGNPTDLAIKGNGFYILKSSNEITDLIDGQYVYTRAGNFGIDSDGNLIYKPNGLKVQGWRADRRGVVDTNDVLMDISLKIDKDGNEISSTTRETTEMELGGNLNSQAGRVDLINGGETGITDEVDLSIASSLPDGLYRIKIDLAKNQAILYSADGVERATTEIPATGNQLYFEEVGLEVMFEGELSDGTADINIIPRQKSTSVVVYDSKGAQHTLDITFTKATDDNKWNYEIRVQETGDEILEGTISEIGDFETKITGSDDKQAIGKTVIFERTGILQAGNYEHITINPGNSAELINIEIDLTEVTQFADEYDVSIINQDGIGRGLLESFQITPTGDMVGIYSNGVSRNLGKIALADVPNPEGLTRFQDTIFLQSPSSGNILAQEAGTFGLGSISSGALEMSNVSLTDEFTDLIISERGFQANSRVITTSDEVLVEALNLKR